MPAPSPASGARLAVAALAALSLSAVLIVTTAPAAVASVTPPHVPMYRVTDLGLLDSDHTVSNGNALNESGAVTGESHDGTGEAYRYESGTMTGLGVLNPGDSSSGLGINAAGVIAGVSSDTNGHYYAVTWTGTSLTAISGGLVSEARDINDTGEVVGEVESGSQKAFIYHSGTMTDLNTLVTGGAAMTLTNASAINQAGDVVGVGQYGMAPGHAFLFHAGKVTDLGTLGGQPADLSSAAAVNAARHVVGNSSGSVNGMFFWDGSMHRLHPVSGFQGDQAHGLNDADWVVGWLLDFVHPQHAFVWPGSGPVVDLNTRVTLPAGWTLSDAEDINNQGQIVAEMSNPTIGEGHAVLLTPAPITRLAGASRFSTAAAISAHTWPTPGSAAVAYIAYAFNFPDALGAAAAAGTVKGPVLLAGTNLPIDPATTGELTRLQPSRIVILGNTGAISKAVADALVPYATSHVVDRYGGANRFQTAAQVSAHTWPTPGSAAVAYIAYAFNFPDALGAAAAAGTVKGPVLLAAKDLPLDPATVAELTRLQPARIVVLGNTGAISKAVADALVPYATSHVVDRYGGANRFQTAAQVSAHTFSPGVPAVYIAYAFNFPDALGGAAAAGTVPGPVLLANATLPLDAATVAEIVRLNPVHIYVLGSSGVVTDAVFDALSVYPTGP